MTATSETTSKSAEAIARLDAAIRAITTSEQFTDFLTMQGRFHAYSFNNVMMICTAKPDATHVAGFKTWLTLNRCVRKGEKGIPILVPHRARIEDETTGERVSIVRGFGVGYVFDVSQTNGDALPEPPRPIAIDAPDALAVTVVDRISHHLSVIGVSLAYEELRDTQNGYWMPGERKIALSTTLPPAMRAKTICHELAHCLCAHSGHDDRRAAEVIAEAAAYVALAQIGIDSEGYSAPYLASWGRDIDAFRGALKEIEAVSRQIVAIIADKEDA